MSEIIWNFYSKSLGRETTLRIYPPDSIEESTPLDYLDDYEIVIALHGLGGSSRQISSYTNIEYLASKFKCWVILPEANRSFFLNSKENFKDYILNEIPQKINSYFNLKSISDKKWNIIGISMGGFGALNLANQSNIFSKSCGISSALDYALLRNGIDGENFILENEKSIIWPWDENHETFTRNINKNIEFCLLCGNQDPFLSSNKYFLDMLKENKGKYKYFFEDGDHSWIYWNKAIIRAFKFIRELDIEDIDID
ncbi:MAG: alpha/beta fold hydrolase [Intestinibacter bartlettii]|uniref:alpha/beta hydrolase n=1 Tax=Intestinibacter bartlettii TaxID=261299 RepID=UPI0028FF44BC|nr:alpha/beta fold hydrolase [Intestinibacter bartlettii]MDU2828972.1 alpha/beta fold hydrolase [Anaerococcus sp.]MDU6064111.1 alpha/beta fold hydrolase [Anaerococcus sp.]MDU6791774.1 alpha/beta fold hydrolase [Anaerococcus sp.]MDU6824512.1 alpha/beta fold hydrolase [Intestinibacter bartlettii]